MADSESYTSIHKDYANPIRNKSPGGGGHMARLGGAQAIRVLFEKFFFFESL